MDSFPCVSEARVPGSIPGGSTLSRISPEWEAVCKTVVAGSTPERGSIFGGGAHAMDARFLGQAANSAWPQPTNSDHPPASTTLQVSCERLTAAVLCGLRGQRRPL